MTEKKSMFIKRVGDQRVNCTVDITVKSIKTTDFDAQDGDDSLMRGPFAMQIVRGPLRSETQ